MSGPKKRFHKKGPISRRSFIKGSGCVAAGKILSSAVGCGDDDDDEDEISANDQPNGGGETQSAVVELKGPQEVPAGSYQTWDIVYTAGDEGLAKGAVVALAVEHGADWGEAKFFGRDKFGGIYVWTDANALLDWEIATGTSSSNALRVHVRHGQLKPGESLTVTIGDPGGEGGKLKAPTIAHAATVRVWHNLHGDKNDKGYLIYEEITPTPTIHIQPLQTVKLDAIAKSTALIDEPVSLVVRAEDEYGNLTPGYEGELDIYDDERDERLGGLSITQADAGYAYVQDIRIGRAGVVRIRIEDRNNGFTEYSDPIEVVSDPEYAGLLWGQMHGHSIVSDGLGTAKEYYDYARNQGNLDFCALTDHGFLTEPIVNPTFFRHYIGEDVWPDYAKATRDANLPGAFTTFLAYEWTSHIYNDKNIYFLNDDEPWEPYPWTLAKLYERYRTRQAMIISQMMWAAPFMRAINWSNFDPELEPVVEIASDHGVREYAGNPYFPEDTWTEKMGFLMRGHLVADGLKKGHKIGIMCGADTHTGRPGSSIAGIQPCRINGLMALRSVENTRQAIWDLIYNRRVYGTTGPRILLDFSFNGSTMGSEVEDAGGARQFDLVVYGKMGISKIELVGDDPREPVDTVSFDPPIWNPGALTLRHDNPPDGESYYYIRVFQEDGHMAWSSPLWIKAL